MHILPGRRIHNKDIDIVRKNFILYTEEEARERNLKVHNFTDENIVRGEYVRFSDGWVGEVFNVYPMGYGRYRDTVVVTACGSYLVGLSPKNALPPAPHPKYIKGFKKAIASSRELPETYRRIMDYFFEHPERTLFRCAYDVVEEEANNRPSTLYVMCILSGMLNYHYLEKYVMQELENRFKAQMQQVSDELNKRFTEKLLEKGIDYDLIAEKLLAIISAETESAGDRKVQLEAIKELNKLFGNYPGKTTKKVEQNVIPLSVAEQTQIARLAKENQEIIEEETSNEENT